MCGIGRFMMSVMRASPSCRRTVGVESWLKDVSFFAKCREGYFKYRIRPEKIRFKIRFAEEYNASRRSRHLGALMYFLLIRSNYIVSIATDHYSEQILETNRTSKHTRTPTLRTKFAIYTLRTEKPTLRTKTARTPHLEQHKQNL